MKTLDVREGYNNLIRSTLFDIFMYIDGADDTLCDAVNNWFSLRAPTKLPIGKKGLCR